MRRHKVRDRCVSWAHRCRRTIVPRHRGRDINTYCARVEDRRTLLAPNNIDWNVTIFGRTMHLKLKGTGPHTRSKEPSRPGKLTDRFRDPTPSLFSVITSRAKGAREGRSSAKTATATLLRVRSSCQTRHVDVWRKPNRPRLHASLGRGEGSRQRWGRTLVTPRCAATPTKTRRTHAHVCALDISAKARIGDGILGQQLVELQ